MRETYIDGEGTERFKPNMIIRYLLEHCEHVDLNRIWRMQQQGFFTDAEMREFYQLINYSVDGYEEIFGEEGHEGKNWG
jgi:hypothetical protein